jgi:hypothetical protein
MAFLSVITRHMPSRADFLALNQASLRLQSDPDYEQVVVVDELGQGWHYANLMLVEAVRPTPPTPDPGRMPCAPTGGGKVSGRYVLVLDDDDMLINAQAIERLKKATAGDPPGVIWRAWHSDAGILPDNGHWKQAPALGFIGACGFCLRTDVFRESILAINQGGYVGHYASDYDLIHEAFRRYGEQIAWLDELMCWAIRRSHGAS